MLHKFVKALVVLLVATATNASTLKITVAPPSLGSRLLDINDYSVRLEGSIDSDAPGRLAGELRKIGKNAVTFYLNSPGGSLAAGLEIGRLIRQHGGNTYVGVNNAADESLRPGDCFSACALAFLGGTYRYMARGSRYGVHRFYKPTAGDTDLDDAQIISASVASFVREMGVDPGLLDLMVRAGRDQVYLLGQGELELLNVVNNGRKRAQWSIEAIDGSMYLRGVQETVWGTGKALFLCGNGVVFYSIAEVGMEKGASMEKGGWVHSLLVDGEFIPLDSPISLKNDNGYLNSVFLLTPYQVQRILQTKSVGHAIQVARDAPIYVGYTVEIGKEAKQRVNAFIQNCKPNR